MIKYLEKSDTIAALATGKGNAALAIIRISGKNSIENIGNCLISKKKFLNAESRKIQLYKFIDMESNKVIDEITTIKYIAPASYTGENMVEIFCHGNELIIDEIFSVLNKNNIRSADRGEFTRRAYLNGKIDLLKAEAINQIISSFNIKQKNTALEMYSGKTKKKLFEWKKIVKNFLVELEAKIEFPEEDDIKAQNNDFEIKIKAFLDAINDEIMKREAIKLSQNGIIIPIVGIANAGKSSLFNLILGFDRTIVHSEEGTTRDVVSEEIIIKGEKVKILDTAGLNDTHNQIEILGIEKSIELIKSGDIIIWVTPADKEFSDKEKNMFQIAPLKRIIAIISKSDLIEGKGKKEIFKQKNIPFIDACFITQNDKEKLISFISETIEKLINNKNYESGVICNKRQEEIIVRMQQKIIKLIENDLKYGEEIAAHEINEILGEFDEFLGQTTSEEIINSIFSEFCIGK
jgi:tRNA modification GTPase